VIRISNLVLARGAKRLLDGAGLTVHAGHRVGLIGRTAAASRACSR